ncbi:MAG: plasmid maintenance system antidote protein [Candidatus Azobacteroides sp.]|nr:plasmid maintenance system antidote protein [Candidatus Azobacteroides sp.]
MLPEISKIKGVFPGAVLSRELKKRGLESKQFALSLGEYPQTINAINKGRRGINPALSIKLGEKLGVDAEYFMLLQAYYEIEKKKQELLANQAKPNVALFQKALFWDTNIDKIDWQKHKRGVIQRVFERGTEAEIKEIISFYGEKTVAGALHFGPQYLPSLAENAKRYLGIDINKKQ